MADETGKVCRMGGAVYLYGSIDNDTVLQCLEALRAAKRKASTKRIRLHITSDGGEIHAAFALCAWIQKCPKPVDTYADSFVASAAAIIFLHGERRYASHMATFLLHSISFGTEGKISTVKDEVALAKHTQRHMVNIIKKNCSVPPKILSRMMKKDIGISPSNALRWGIVTEVR